MRRSDSPFTGLCAVESKRLIGLLKTYLRDYPDLPAEDLAAIWHDEQESLMAGTWLESYLQDSSWEREVPRAITALRREAAYKAKAKSTRQLAKERHLDRQPATPRQKKLLSRLTKGQADPPPIETLSKLKANQIIHDLLTNPTPPLPPR